MKEDNRCISPGFINDLKNKDILGAFVEKIRRENNLELCFRGNDDAVNIYCNNLTVWKIHDKNKKGEYKVEVSLHKSIDNEERKKIATILKDKLDFNSFERNGNTRRNPYIKRTNYDKDFVDQTYDLLIPMIQKYFDNGKHLEKIRQQEIFSALTKKNTGFYIYDMEQQQKGEKKEGQNLSDMIAVRYQYGRPIALSLIEVKSTKQACKDVKSGIIPHLDGMAAYIQTGKMSARQKEACEIINAYRTLGIHNAPAEKIEPEMFQNSDIVLILTDEAINYFRTNESVICKHINNRIKNKCEIFEWNSDKRILSPMVN